MLAAKSKSLGSGEALPSNQQRRGGKGRAISAGDGANEEGKNKPLGGGTAQEVEGGEHKDDGHGIVDGTGEGFDDGFVDDLNVTGPAMVAE